MSGALGLRPFIPAKDHAASIRFYEALGFVAAYRGADIAILDMGPCSFILQDFYVEALASNLMMQLMVRDVDAWWARLDPGALVAAFGVRPPIPPAVQSWGAKVGFVFDPAGVLWHVTEQRPS